MDVKEFIASLVGSLAWPAAVVVLVFVLRDQIRALLGQQVTRLKAGPLELEWDTAVAETRKELPPGIVGPESSASVVADLYDIADRLPAAAVLEAYKRVEEALARRIGGTYEGELPARNARELARLARDLDLITDSTVRAVDGLATLRNLAAHNPSGSVSPEEAREFLGIAQAVLFSVSTWLKPDDPDAT